MSLCFRVDGEGLTDPVRERSIVHTVTVEMLRPLH